MSVIDILFLGLITASILIVVFLVPRVVNQLVDKAVDALKPGPRE